MSPENTPPTPDRGMAMLDPVTVEITAPVDPDQAFALFSGDFGKWWPIASHSLSKEKCTGLEMRPGLGGKIIETAQGIAPVIWGEIEIWLPGEQLSFTWHPGWDAGDYTRISVTFDQNRFGHCEIRLVHWEWENLGEIATPIRDSYVTGWPYVFGQCFANYLRKPA
ncbi:MAG: SRPBCC domain-containing protein [Pseudomonadota bacterium]